MEVGQRVPSRTVSPPEACMYPCKREWMCVGTEVAKGMRCPGWLGTPFLLASFSSLELILAAPRAEQRALPEISSQMSGCHMPGHWASQWGRPPAEASETGGHRSVGPGHQHLHPAVQATERGNMKERSNLFSRVSSKIWIHRPLRISLVFSLDHSEVWPFQAGRTLLHRACSGII